MKLLITSQIAMVAIISLSGCSTWEKLITTKKGAVIGTGTGALIGNSVSSGSGALIGGAAGGLGGGLIGHEIVRRDRNRNQTDFHSLRFFLIHV